LIHILYGKDDFSLQQVLTKLKDELGNREMLEVNTTIMDGQQLSLSQLIDACSTVPFLCPYRLIIVRGLLGRFESKTGQRQRVTRSRAKLNSGLEEWIGLADYVKQMPPTTVLALVDGEIKHSNRLLKSLAPLAKVMGFAPLSDKNLSDWIKDRVERGGGTILPGAIKLLVGLVGADLWAMSSEVDKLLTYCSGQPISEDSVRQVTSYAREASIFALVDSILEGRRKVAQQLLHRLLHDGAAPSYVLVMITRQLRLIVLAKELGQRLFRPETRGRLEPTSDYGLDKAVRQAKAYTLERIKKAYRKLLEADIAIKTGKYDGDLALDLLVVELCQD
jgi:DNA polymerase-3 subunit delta